MEKIIVIGTNHAGTATINTILGDAEGKKNFKITTYDSNTNISFLGCGIALWVGGELKDASGLFYSSPEIMRENNVNVFMEHKVENIDFNEKIVTIKNLETSQIIKDSYDKLVLSVGSWPIVPKFNNVLATYWENLINIKLYQHGKELINKLKDEKIKNVAIVGCGYIGIELAEACKKYGKNVTIIDIEKQLLTRYYDEEFSQLMEENLKNHDINFALGEKVEEFLGDNRQIRKVLTNKGQYETDLVLLSIGFKPNTEFLKNTKLKLSKEGAILVNSSQETNIKDVYAVGDCATVHSNVINDDTYIALATNAVHSGRAAGFAILNKNIPFYGTQGSNAIKIYDLGLLSTGFNEKMAKENNIDFESVIVDDMQKPGFMIKDNEKVKLKVLYEKKTHRIIGAQIASKYDVSMLIHLFSLAIQENISIDKLAMLDLFFLPHYNQPYNYINEIGLKVKNK